jgi:hypothetical protein
MNIGSARTVESATWHDQHQMIEDLTTVLPHLDNPGSSGSARDRKARS